MEFIMVPSQFFLESIKNNKQETLINRTESSRKIMRVHTRGPFLGHQKEGNERRKGGNSETKLFR